MLDEQNPTPPPAPEPPAAAAAPLLVAANHAHPAVRRNVSHLRNYSGSDIGGLERDGYQPVLMLSGGRTSAFMLRLLLDAVPDYGRRFLTIFENTGKERDETLEFLHEIETRWNVPLIWLEYTRVPAAQFIADAYPHKTSKTLIMKQLAAGTDTHWFKQVDYQTAHRNLTPDSPFDKLLHWASVLPNLRARICSTQLKTRTALRYLYSRGVFKYAPLIGIRADESHRCLEILANCSARERPQFPLAAQKVTARQVNDYWVKSSFDLKLKQHEGNCDMCFLKAHWKRVAIARDHPEFLPWWINAEENAKAKMNEPVFRIGEPYSMIKTESEHQELNFRETGEPACSCLDGGYKAGADLDCAF